MGDIAIDDIVVFKKKRCAVKPRKATPRPPRPTPVPTPPGMLPHNQCFFQASLLRNLEICPFKQFQFQAQF